MFEINGAGGNRVAIGFGRHPGYLVTILRLSAIQFAANLRRAYVMDDRIRRVY